MKNLVLAVLLVVGLTTFAQEKRGEKREKLTPEQRINFQVKKMTKDLTLNEKQVKEVEALVTKEVTKRDEKRTEMKAKKAERDEMEKPTKEEIEARKIEVQKEQANMKAEMKKILTPEQYTKWEQNLEERKEKMIERIKDKKQKGKKPQEEQK